MQTPVLSPRTESKGAIDENLLYPVFLKLENFKTLIIGGGNIGLEKLSALLANCPVAHIHLVGTHISDAIKLLSKEHPNVCLAERSFVPDDLDGVSWVIMATDLPPLHRYIYSLCKERNVLLNIADTPDLCDMYLGSVVQKGHLKIAISTNGKSPTLAKRLKEILSATIPNDINESLDNLHHIRNQLKGDFQHKVEELNKLTQSFVEPSKKRYEKKVRLYVTRSLFALLCVGIGVLGTTLVQNAAFSMEGWHAFFDSTFFLVLLVGFIAQMVDGALGMAYGVSANTFLLSLGIHPAAASASVHTAEIFTSAASGASHWRMKNVDLSLFKKLLLPGIIGAIMGAFLLSSLSEYTVYLKFVIGCYTFLLGVKIFIKAFQTIKKQTEVKRVGVLAFAGAFLDSIGGGGWGPIVATNLLSRGGNPRYTIGSVNLTEFFVTLASSLTFVTLIGINHWKIIAALIVGGVVAAPFGAYLTKRISPKTLMIMVGTVITILSVRIIYTIF